MTDTAPIVRLLKSTPRVEVTDEAYNAMKAIIFDKLNIVGAVASCQRVAAQQDAALKRAMPCYDAERCDGKKCEAECE